MRFTVYVAIALPCALARFAGPQTLPFAPLESASSGAFYPGVAAITEGRPVVGKSLRLSNRTLTIAAWPGYGMLEGDRSPSARSLRLALVAERFGFIADLASTARGLTMRDDFAERDPINTLFGNRNVAGVLGSMTAWEVGYSYASVKVPALLRKTRLRGTAQSSALILDSLLAGQRIRVSACNLRLTRERWISPTASCEP